MSCRSRVLACLRSAMHRSGMVLHGEHGFSLVEELVSLAVIAGGLVLLLGITATGATGVTMVTDEVSAETLARSQLELLKEAAYQPDPSVSPYPTVSAPAPYTVSTSIEYWDWDPVSGSGNFTSTVVQDGMQRLTVTVQRAGDILSLQMIKVER